jgi:phosphoribosyl-ATP pyrophosphohydrolase/phosphoribosyl-AMP cyclohydrolase
MSELVPTIIQDAITGRVLMLGYSNEESLATTRTTGLVTFFSRSKQRLWTKGETSGNHLKVKDILFDCDNDTILIKAVPAGPTCHTGSDTCFGEANSPVSFLLALEEIIKLRKAFPSQESYVSTLLSRGTAKIAQKVGEEGVETVIEALRGDAERLSEESADLVFHLLVLLVDQNISFESVVNVLKGRHKHEKNHAGGSSVEPDPS